jgi:thioredoxin reductase (NADPH)
MLFVAQRMEPNNELAKQLKIRLDEHGFIVTDTEQVTNVEGVFAAGDLTKLNNHQVSSAVHEGGMAAAAANYYLYEEWQKE